MPLQLLTKSRTNKNAVSTMIKPIAIAIVLVAALLVSSSTAAVAATLPATEADSSSSSNPGALNLLAPSSRVPPHERKLAPQFGPICVAFEGGEPVVVPCSFFSCPGLICAADEDTAPNECASTTGAYELTNPNQPNCAWKYACCTVTHPLPPP